MQHFEGNWEGKKIVLIIFADLLGGKQKMFTGWIALKYIFNQLMIDKEGNYQRTEGGGGHLVL